MLLDALVVRDAVPRDAQQEVEEIAFGAGQAERVAAARGRFGGDGCGQGLEAEAVGHAWHGEGADRAVRNVEDAGHQLCAVAVGGRDEELAAVGAGGAGEFEGEVGEVGDAHCARELGQGGEVLEDGGAGDVGDVVAGVPEVVAGVLEVAGGEPEVGVGEVDVVVDQGGVGIVGGAAGEGFEGGELAVFGVDVVEDEASPEKASRLASFGMFYMARLCLTYQNLPCLKAVDSNAVTMPKLLEPPLRASQRSEYESCVALTRVPHGKTTYQSMLT